MGIGMQIGYLGFAAAARTEAEAAVQLLRLERFGHILSGCCLSIEQMHGPSGAVFDIRLDLILRNNGLIVVPHCINADAQAGLHDAFDCAERLLLAFRHTSAQIGV